ncbi:MAG TPA: hypothetical protein VKE40_01440 [Gemmataceae bacterium]|nr:hypothetical protein [Gemmataceae bacterium]
MPILSNPAFGPRTAIAYITVGALLDVWTGVWYFTFARDQQGNLSQQTWFWLWGLFLTGLTLIVIGLLLGSIGRSARKAELPPAEAEAQEAAIQQTAAATPHPIMPGAVPGTMTTPIAVPMTVPVQTPASAPVLPSQSAPPAAPGGVTTRR